MRSACGKCCAGGARRVAGLLTRLVKGRCTQVVPIGSGFTLGAALGQADRSANAVPPSTTGFAVIQAAGLAGGLPHGPVLGAVVRHGPEGCGATRRRTTRASPVPRAVPPAARSHAGPRVTVLRVLRPVTTVRYTRALGQVSRLCGPASKRWRCGVRRTVDRAYVGVAVHAGRESSRGGLAVPCSCYN